MPRLSEPLKNLLYFERFVNNGSPTGQTFIKSSSTPTSPLNCPGYFRLPFVLVPKEDVKTLNDAWLESFPEISQQIMFPVHPDLIDRLEPRYHKQVVWQPRLIKNAFPTASPRTVLVFDAHQRACCLKLDYPLELGRFPSDLAGEKLWVGPHISAFLASRSTDQHIYFLPEIDAVESVIFTNSKRSGNVLRLWDVWSTHGPLSTKYKLLPAFSLFSLDKLESKKKPLIAKLLQNTHNPAEKLLNTFIAPLIKSYWTLSLGYGLIPEAHAQNFLFGFDMNLLSTQPIIIWRDLQGFFRDEARLSPDLAKLELGTYHLLPSGRQTDAQQRRSYLYDWILGHYFLDVLIETAQLYCAIDFNEVQERIIEMTCDMLSTVESDYLPRNEWYSMSLEPPQSKYLPLIVNKNPRYR